jgi:hypothetical protein
LIVDKELEVERVDVPQPSVTLAEIADEVAVCRACNLSQCRIATRAGRGGGGRVKLMIVGSWLSESPEIGIAEEIQFGIEEDLMLSRMLTAINIRTGTDIYHQCSKMRSSGKCSTNRRECPDMPLFSLSSDIPPRPRLYLYDGNDGDAGAVGASPAIIAAQGKISSIPNI